MLNTPIRRLTVIGTLEGISYLALLGIAMPLKYFAGIPLAVRIVGSLHGALFVLFFAAVFEVAVKRNWWSSKYWTYAILASILPFGTFIFDSWVKRMAASEEAG
jgi:integral membrane protein